MLPDCHHIPWLIDRNPHFPAPFPHQLARVAQNYPEQMSLGSHDSLQHGTAAKEIALGLPHDPMEDWERGQRGAGLYKWGVVLPEDVQQICEPLVLWNAKPGHKGVRETTQRRSRAARKQVE